MPGPVTDKRGERRVARGLSYGEERLGPLRFVVTGDRFQAVDTGAQNATYVMARRFASDDRFQRRVLTSRARFGTISKGLTLPHDGPAPGTAGHPLVPLESFGDPLD